MVNNVYHRYSLWEFYRMGPWEDFEIRIVMWNLTLILGIKNVGKRSGKVLMILKSGTQVPVLFEIIE